MPHNRFFIDASLEEGAITTLSDAECHHLHVLRPRLGDTVELINGKGVLATATVVSIDRKRAALRIERVDRAEDVPQIVLAQGLPRMNHLDWIIEKGTELGVTAFWLFPGILSEKTALTHSQTQRLKNLALSAVKQCGRLDLPTIAFMLPLETWRNIEGTLLYGSLAPDTPLLWQLPSPLKSPVVLFIGPERGFDTKELAHLNNALQASPVRLHPYTLRTETASLAAVSIIQSMF